MTTYMEFTYQELACLADALAHYRKDSAAMRIMDHTYNSVTELRSRIRRAMADYVTEGK